MKDKKNVEIKANGGCLLTILTAIFITGFIIGYFMF